MNEGLTRQFVIDRLRGGSNQQSAFRTHATVGVHVDFRIVLRLCANSGIAFSIVALCYATLIPVEVFRQNKV